MAEHSNRLIDESSPYLRQHAHNPVDWYPWGEEAFAKARAENKPVFLSVGYSACHWCHVMERESFENPEIAEVMNELFVNIKVDREERPDVDQIYMNAVQMLTGRGGWPMSVFLTPAGEPFYGGTYFPPEERHGMPGFPRVLKAIAQAYHDKPEDVQRTADQLVNALERIDDREAAETPTGAVVAAAAAKLAQAYDETNGGLGQAPKFPNSSAFELFLRVFRATGERSYLDMVLNTLRKMANGGIYDQLGGGFHRYSVDARWLVPHFEKMLYDNAQLVPLYLYAYQAGGDPFFARIARETLDYVIREMRSDEGGFYSTQDADSEGVEGKFFLWDVGEVRDLLGDELPDLACRYWDITDVGNFEGRNILHVTLEIEQLAKLFGRDDADRVRDLLQEARARLFAAREKRIKPGLDDKILTAWNGLMISAFARAARVLGDDGYERVAVDAVEFIETRVLRGDRLLSSYKDGAAKLNGYLDDYAFVIAGLIDVFELTQNRGYLHRALELGETTLRRFWDDSTAGFFFTSDDHERLITRTKPAFDGSIPSGNSVMAHNLLRLSHLADRPAYRNHVEQLLRLHATTMADQPFGMANMLSAADAYVQHPREIFILGKRDAADTRALLECIGTTYVPNHTLTVVEPGGESALPEVMRGKTQIDGRATAYVCHRMTCSLPVTSRSELETLLVR